MPRALPDMSRTTAKPDSRAILLEKKAKKGLRALAARTKALDWRGHFRSGANFRQCWGSLEKYLQEMFDHTLLFSFRKVKDLQGLVAAFEKGVLLDEPIDLHTPTRECLCPVCGESLRLGFNGVGLVVLSDPCAYPEGLVTEWELNVPSGKLVVANDLREWFPSDEDYDVNLAVNRHLTTLGYAKVGMSHGFVSNTCPGVYRSGGRFIIGNYHDELWDDEKNKFYPNPEPCPWGEEVAGVCTDLWWYSIVDFDEFMRRVSHYTPNANVEELLKNVTVVEVTPGVYKFRHDHNIDYDVPLVEYASFEWVREPDEVRDYLAEERAKSLNATEVLIQHCIDWPTLYMDMDSLKPHGRDLAIARWKEMTAQEKTQSLARAADHIMCTIGGGVEWHENGFPRTVMTEEAKQFASEVGEIPPFDFETHWYPISAGYGGICLGAGIENEHSRRETINLAPSFVLLGLNICQNAIKFGEHARLSNDVYPPAFDIATSRKRMRLFVDCYQGLRKRYPDLVFDAEFDRWMRETDIDQYIANFDFGPAHPPKDTWGPMPKTVKTGEFFVFDANLLKNGSFCWHPAIMTAWAKKTDAKRYALGTLSGVESEIGFLFYKDHSARTSVPLRVVGRVIRGTGKPGVGHRSKQLEVAFDYGTPEMKKERWVIGEGEMAAVRQFDDPKEYGALLEEHKSAFNIEEAEMKKAKAKK